jgi:hypothetical protein
MICNHNKGNIQVGNTSCDIDLGIYDLINELLKADIFFTDSCESTIDDRISITFRSTLGAEDLLSIINTIDDQDEECSLSERSQFPTSQCFDTWGYDLGFVYSDPSNKFASDVILVVIVTFPKSDYDEVLRRVKEHNN